MVTAKLNYLHIAPRKVRLVADLIRGKSIEEAQTVLNFTIKKAAKPLMKLLNQAAASARNNFQQESSNLYISKIAVDEGPKYKRWRARARGRAFEIQKKTSHVTIVLSAISGKKIEKVKKIRKAPAVRPEKIKKVLKVEKPSKESKPPAERAKFRPERELVKPKIEKGAKRIFRRKAF